MSITFNNIPTTLRTPAVYVEVDNSRALKGLVQNPHKVLLIGQMSTTGSAAKLTPKQIFNENTAAGFFGNGSLLDRMARTFKKNNPYTEVWAIALSEGGTTAAASAAITASGTATAAGGIYLLLGGTQVQVAITSGWSVGGALSVLASEINMNSGLCFRASYTALASVLYLLANTSGTAGNGFDARKNFYDGQADCPGLSLTVAAVLGGAGTPSVADVWAVIDTTQYQHIIHPYTDSTFLAAVETELATRFGPMVDMQGHAYTAVRGTAASCATLGLTRNSPFQTIIGAYDSPTNPENWAAALGAVASYNLNNDPARPLHFLTLQGVIPPTIQSANRFSQSERNILLYDGISTWIVDSGGNVLVERCITTYRTNALGLPDVSYLDIETLFTILEIRYQYKARMAARFIIPRFKLADDGNVYPAGSSIATPSTVKQETIALFTQLRDVGLIENLDEFSTNLVVERDASDRNRINCLLAPDLINQFRILAGQIQFIL